MRYSVIIHVDVTEQGVIATNKLISLENSDKQIDEENI
jgi:hypothetical protein